MHQMVNRYVSDLHNVNDALGYGHWPLVHELIGITPIYPFTISLLSRAIDQMTVSNKKVK
jgi:hypothetical protein